MSRSPEELGREALALLGADDAEGLVAFCHPDVEIQPLIASLSGRDYSGHEGVRRWFEDLASSFDERRAEITEVEELGPDGVLGAIQLHLRGRGSGIEIDQTIYCVGHFHEEKLTYWGLFERRDAARAALEARTPPDDPG